MRTQDTIQYTYDWLNTAFSSVPKYENVAELYKKNSNLLGFNYEEMEEYILGIDLNEKINALADMRVVVVNNVFFQGITSDLVIDMYNFRRDFIFDTRMKLHTVDVFAELLSLIRNNNQITDVNIVVDVLVLCEVIACKLTKDKTLTLLKNEDKATYLSNMTKFCKSEEEAKETVELYKTGKHPNKIGKVVDVRYEETGNIEYPYRILTNGDNKIMKSKEFQDVEQFK